MESGWIEKEVGDHTCDIFHPKERNPNGYVVIYLHGVHLGKLIDESAFVDQFEQNGLVAVCPMTQRSWWTDRICREFDSRVTAEKYVINSILPFIESEYGAVPPRIALLGTSMGGQGALRMSYKYPDKFPVVSGISPAIDYYRRMEVPEDDDPLLEMYDDPEAARQDSAILHIHPLNWPRKQFFCCDPVDYAWFDSADRLRMKLGSLGVPFECDLETSAGGHGFDYYNVVAKKSIDFIVNSLNSERLRVV